MSEVGKKYRRKPTIVEVVRFENEDLTTLNKLVKFLSNNHFNSFKEYEKSNEKQHLAFSILPYRGSEYEGIKITIKTLEGTLNVSVGDYIIKEINGDFYPCKLDIFEKTYEECVELEGKMQEITSYEEAIEFLGIKDLYKDGEIKIVETTSKHYKALSALSKLFTIAEAWNKKDGFIPDFSNKNQCKYSP